ncbi:MAG: dTDP-4-dehydrorhamnose reductase [Bradyrhizobiaceae bacterium]|nr:dTDP-4-dehydrorhamnose reductase [Bradyrhizobiaceae bacterium]
MKVLLLGPNGQLGCDIRRLHEEVGARVDLVPVGRDLLDVAAPGEVDRVLGAFSFDAIVNCTSYHRTDEVEDNATLGFAVNAHAVQAMARLCNAKRARLVHISTDYVFGGDTTRDRPLREDDPTAPVNVYGASKAMGETLARLACEDVVILRVASLFGVAGASGKGGNFVETVIRRGREKGELRVVEDQIMSPTATADIARVVLRMLTEDCAPGSYHVVNSGPASWFEFAREIIRRAGIDATVVPCTSAEYSSRAMRPRYSALDNAKVAFSFGHMPPWQEALDRYLRAKGHVIGAANPADDRTPNDIQFANNMS